MSADKLDSIADVLAQFCEAAGALQSQHAAEVAALRAERDEAMSACATLLNDVTVLRNALEEIEGTYDDGTPAQIIAEDALAALDAVAALEAS